MDILDLLKNPTFWVVVAWVAREAWRSMKRKDHDVAESIKEVAKETARLTIAITKLEIQLEMIHESIKLIPRMQKDINAAHELLRHRHDV